jgi:Abnormal spindle-like microcephaly-assoc'd, ASPM-SPD-2-Hydin
MRRNSSIHSHVRMFAIALATMVAAFTLVSPAKAEIVYHSTDIGINGGTYNLDLNGDGVTDFTITSLSESCGTDCNEGRLDEGPASGNAAIVGPLKRGDEIGPNQAFDGNAGLMSFSYNAYLCWPRGCFWEHWSWGPWLGKTGYLGLSFQINGQIHYGWAKLKCRGGIYGGGFGTLLGYAYETIPGRAILAGETSYVWFTPALLNFGTVTLGTTASGSATLTNLGPTTVTITNAKLTGLNSADFASENGNPPCAGSVTSGATCTLTFTFTPTIAGKERATYSVYDNTGGSPQKLSLVGTGE